jgi:hypothetical protein
VRSEDVRQAVYRSLCEALGEPQAVEVMDLLDKVDRMLLAQEGAAAVLRGDMAELRGETRALGSQLRGEMAELRGEMATLASQLRGEIAEVRGEMAALGGDMTRLESGLRADMATLDADLRGEVRAMLPKLVATNMASIVGAVGLVLAAAQLL